MTKDKKHKVGEYIPMPEQKQNPYYLATHMGEGWQDGFDGKPVRSTFDGYKLGYVEGNTARKALANEALEKMAENARELGLDYEPEQDWIERERAVGYREGHRAALAQRTWVGLTDEEISAIDWKSDETLHDFARAIEAKLKEKNNV